MSKYLKLAAKIGMGYFIIYSAIYVLKWWETNVRFSNRGSQEDINFAYILLNKYSVANIPGQTVFRITAILAIIGFVIWVYWVIRGDKPATFG